MSESSESESNSAFTPEELAALNFKTPAFKRWPKIKASRKLREDLNDPGKSGGVYSRLDPVNPGDLLGLGIPTRPFELSDIALSSTDPANTALNPEEKGQVVEIIQGKRQYLSPKEVNHSVNRPRLPAFQAFKELFATAKSRAKMFIRKLQQLNNQIR